jgi:glycosyltransferase involved in cell wall biosynthesis
MISILMPIYNGIEFIEESVSSVLNQTYEQWELLIGINGHPPNSNVYKIAKEYEKKSENAGEPLGKIRVFDFYEIKGKSNTLNEMIKYCNYNYIALLDVDDIWHNEKLNVQSQLLNYYDVIGSKCVWFGDRTGDIPDIPLGDISNYNFSLVNPIINSSSIIKKELCYWNENGIEDYDLWLRLRRQNKKFYNFKEILVKHRIHSSSAFNSKGNDNKVDNLLISHGFKSRAEKQNDPTRIQVPQINKIKMKLF